MFSKGTYSKSLKKTALGVINLRICQRDSRIIQRGSQKFLNSKG